MVKTTQKHLQNRREFSGDAGNVVPEATRLPLLAISLLRALLAPSKCDLFFSTEGFKAPYAAEIPPRQGEKKNFSQKMNVIFRGTI